MIWSAMQTRFEVKLLSEALKFLQSLDSKTADKIFENIREARMTNNPLLFKKLRGSELWECRTRYGGNQYRTMVLQRGAETPDENRRPNFRQVLWVHGN